jgi:hypothetical protein
MMMEISPAERDLLKKILESYVSDLRQTIAATKRETSPLHMEEDLVKGMQRKLATAD